MYFVVSRSANVIVKGKLPLIAEEALAAIETARRNGQKLECCDGGGKSLSLNQLRKEVRR
jgi:hypothetical protein